MIEYVQFQYCLIIIMFRNIYKKILRPLSSPLFIAATTLALSPYLYSIIWNKNMDSIINPFSLWRNKIECLQTIRANKPEIVKLLNECKQQTLILIYNRQSEQKLRDQIIKYEQIAEKQGIKKVVLVDQTDVRHLQTFTLLIRQQIDEDDKGTNRQPLDLHNKIKSIYINPNFDTNKPFFIKSKQQLTDRIHQIRNILKLNPTQQQLKQSISKFNNTTVIKNCFNNTCVEEYKEKVRQLIQLDLFKDKTDNFNFYVTNSKQQAAKIAPLVGESSNKQEIYVFRNDFLGKETELFSTFMEKQGNQYKSQNCFMMMIRPRVHIISRKSLSTDLYWYISSLRMNQVPTFSINNTMSNLPIRLINNQTNPQNNQLIVWSKGHYKQRQLLQKIKSKYGNKVQLLVLQTNIPSQLFRHLYIPQRYCIFKLTPSLPYPKMLIKPPTINMDVKTWNKLKKIKYNQQNEKQNQSFSVVDSVEGDKQNYDEKWGWVIEKINKFVEKPINYDKIKMLGQKQLQINGQQLKQMLNFTKTNNSRPNDQKWIFRVCGIKNSCLYSVYQKYGIDINTPVYKLDGLVQNVAIDEGDYEVDGNSINLLS